MRSACDLHASRLTCFRLVVVPAVAIIVIVSLLACGGGIYLGWRKGCHHAAGFSKLANLGRSNDNFALLGSGASPAPEKQYGTPSMPQKKYDTQVDMYNGGDDQL